MIDKIRCYFDDTKFRYTVYTNCLHIINFSKILSLTDTRVSVLVDNKRIIFKGNNFILNKLFDREVLISGSVTGIEVNE